MDDYQKALLAHIREVAPQTEGYMVDTIYIGGGTPSYYGKKRLKEIIKLIKKRYKVNKDAEITVEANPESADQKLFSALRWVGVNRISMGMQSVQEEELRSVGRPHSHGDTVRAVDCARRAKIRNLSLDIIYGLPGQSDEGWRETVEGAIALQPEHISAYGLKVEEGTPLFERVRNGETVPDDDVQAKRYLWTVERLRQGGYIQYEISNFAKEGYESQHNMRYWRMSPYIGFGPGAHSDFGDRRYAMVRDLEGYIQGVQSGGALVDECELIPRRERGGEYIMLALRTTEGIQERTYRSEYLMNFRPLEERLEEFARQNWAEKTEDGRWHLTPLGMLVSNTLIGTLLECQQPEELTDKIKYTKHPHIPIVDNGD